MSKTPGWHVRRQIRFAITNQSTTGPHLGRSPSHAHIGRSAWKKKKTIARSGTTLDNFLDKPCPVHSVLLNSCPTDSLRDCWVIRHVAKGGLTILNGTSRHAEDFSGDDEVLMIYETFTSNNQRKRALREVNSIRRLPARGTWIDTPITFDHKD
jgi:hypothetical protein